jgi:hypothetical protein
MNITFDEKNNDCHYYQNLINNETDRVAMKNFTKHFGGAILKSVLKIHQKLKSSQNALIYNQTSSGDNKIEKLQGTEKKEPLVLKVRIQSEYRKFFHYLENEKACLTEEWAGQFSKVENIHVFQVNKHDYKSLKR